MAQKFNMQTKKTNPPPQQIRDKICPGGGGDITILWEGGRQHHPHIAQLPCHQTGKTDAENNEMVKQLLDYCATQEEAIITYTASKMILNVHSNAGHLNEKRDAAEQGDIFSNQTTRIPPTTMVQS